MNRLFKYYLLFFIGVSTDVGEVCHAGNINVPTFALTYRNSPKDYWPIFQVTFLTSMGLRQGQFVVTPFVFFMIPSKTPEYRKGTIGHYVYRHIRHDKNVVFYVGMGHGYSYQRAYVKTKRGSYWKSIVAKTDYSVEIIMDGLTRKQAEEKEKEFIKLYGLKRDGGTLCNMTLGGDGCIGLSGKLSPNYGKKYPKERVENTRMAVINAFTEETREKQRLAALRRPPVSDETKKKISEAGKRQVYSEERRKAISERQKGIPQGPLSDAHKEKISQKMKGRKFSDETKRKMSEAAKGKRKTSEHALKIKEGKKKYHSGLLKETQAEINPKACQA